MAVDLIAKSWPSWEFSSESVSHRHASDEGWNYHYVPSIRFYEQVEEQLGQNPKINLLKSTLVSEVRPVEDCLELVLESGSDVTESASRVVTAGQIVDTRVPAQVDVGSAMLKQVFFGLEVRLESPHRLGDVAQVMKDMRVDNEGFMFDYVLPQSAYAARRIHALCGKVCRRKVFGQTRWNRCAECAVTRRFR